MAETYNWDGIGRVEISPDSIKCAFEISSGSFFDRFDSYLGGLHKKDKKAVQKAIDGGGSEALRDSATVRKAFQNIDGKVNDSGSGGSSSARDEKSGGSKSESVNEEDMISIPVEVKETITAHFTYDFLSEEEESDEESDEEEKEEDPDEGIESKTGVLTIKNTADAQAIWDIVGEIKTEVPIENLEENLEIKRLGAEEEVAFEYELTQGKKPQLEVKEFISTINDAEKKTYSLNIDQENMVLFKLFLKNPEDSPAKNIIIEKTLFEGYTSVSVQNASHGDYTTEDGMLKWEIEELPENSEAEIEFTIGVQVNDKEETVRSGTIQISYDLPESQSGISIENFNAFGNNNVMIEDEQMDEQPDMYRSQFFFENLSQYTAKVLSLDIQEPNAESGLVTLPDEELYIQPDKMWESEAWEIDTQGDLPQYTKDVQFTLMHQLSTMTSMSISVDDIELAVAMFEAGIQYDIGSIESQRQVPFNAVHTLTNGGAAPFDYLQVEHTVPNHFIPPKKEEIVVKKNGEVIEIDPENIKISPDSYDSDGEHQIVIELDDLRDTDIGMFDPNDELTVEYPIIADKLSEDETFITNARWTANTYPRGEPIVIEEVGEAEGAVIEVVHKRIKLLRGKAVRATSDPEVFEVVIQVRNNSTHHLEQYEVRDRVPTGFEIEDPSMEVSSTEKLDGKEVMVWILEDVDVDEKFEITYMMRAKKKDARASEAQFSM